LCTTTGYEHSDVYLSKEKYFNNREYLLGDLAFSASSVLVPAFKKGNNSNLREDQIYFNTKLAKVLIKSEHCLGLLKVWFQHFWGHRQAIQSKRDLDVILQMMMCACILHNLLINHAIPQDWMDKSMELEEDEELDHCGEMGNRRDQLLTYLMEICYVLFSFNRSIIQPPLCLALCRGLLLHADGCVCSILICI